MFLMRGLQKERGITLIALVVKGFLSMFSNL